MITDQIVRQTTNVLYQIHTHTLASRYKIKKTTINYFRQSPSQKPVPLPKFTSAKNVFG